MLSSLLSSIHHDTFAQASLGVSSTLFVASLSACIGIAHEHSLFTNALAWLSICAACTYRNGWQSLYERSEARARAWAAGALFSIAQLCERAADREGIWWAKAVIPACIFAFALVGSSPGAKGDTQARPHHIARFGSRTTLAVLTSSALAAVYTSSEPIAAVALGLSYAVLSVLALRLCEEAFATAKPRAHANGSALARSIAEDSQLWRFVPSALVTDTQWVSVLQHVSLMATTVTAFATFGLEGLDFDGIVYIGVVGQVLGEHWILGQAVIAAVSGTAMVVMHGLMDAAFLFMIGRNGAFTASFVPLSAVVCSQLILDPSPSRLWFAALYAASCLFLLDEQKSPSTGPRMKLRGRAILTLAAIVSLFVFALLQIGNQIQARAGYASSLPKATQRLIVDPPSETFAPLQFSSTRVHPIGQLVEDAQISWNTKLQSQSQTLRAAVAEYRRRYGIPPPPNFDKWYEFAKSRGVQLIDEYDTIYHSLLPFWALKPSTIRSRAREALGYDNALMGLLVRDGKVVRVEDGPDWLQQAAVGMMESFVEHLPDMDLAFNLSDEPRVVVPHDELRRLVQTALERDIVRASENTTPRNRFSPKPEDVNSGRRIAEAKTTRFSQYAHQPTWISSRMSCPLESPARALEEAYAADNFTAFALSDMGFIYNQTAFSDICNSPSFATSHGFFDRPNSYSVVHELFPIFSQSKMSSYQDITYPSPWYWYGKVTYDPERDMDFKKKQSKLWWRGSTTGGFSRAGGWKRQHRQQFVRKVNALDKAKILEKRKPTGSGTDAVTEWSMKEVARTDYKPLMDVYFSHIGQCDPGDCDAQKEYFTVVDAAEQQDAWNYKYLLDLDGNAFSGRFYAFLLSQSLTFKMAVFREWHQEWIQPWVHYIPLSLRADEVLETVRYFDAEDEARPKALQIASASRDWAKKALRNEDFEVWLFRLLLEYARVVDDNRSSVGYSGA